MAVITDRTTEQSDPAYTPQGGVAGANVWGLAGLEEVGITDVQYGNMPADMGKLWLPTALISMSVIERKNAVAGAFQPLGGTDVTIGVQVGAGALLPDVADFKT